jgi:hypothetical protein
MARRGFVAAGFISVVLAVFVTVLVGAILANPVQTAVNGINTSLASGVSNPSMVNIVPNIPVLYVLMLLLVPIVGIMALAAIIS